MARGKDPVPSWTWMLFGLSLGLIVALIVYLRSLPPLPPTAAPTQTLAPPVVTDAEPAAENSGQEVSSRFDFYEILPQFEIDVPENETAERPESGIRSVNESGSYVLQAGSFTAASDADGRRASLALLGIESRIEQAVVNDARYHRVRIGPISDLNELNRVRRLLADARIESLVMQLPAE